MTEYQTMYPQSDHLDSTYTKLAGGWIQEAPLPCSDFILCKS